MTAHEWVNLIRTLNYPANTQYARCIAYDKRYGVDSKQSRVEYIKYAAILTSIGIEHYRVWLADYTKSMIELVPRIGKQAVLDNFARLQLSCAEWQEEMLVDAINRVNTFRTAEDSILNVDVSGFKNYRSTEPITVNLHKFLSNRKYALQVEELRKVEDKATRDQLKSALPCITPSGVFSKRLEENLIAYSGFVQFDIDAKDNPAYFEGVESIESITALCNSIKSELCKQPFIAYVGLSVSGRGLWGLIPVADPVDHKAHFASIVNYFDSIGIVLDKAPSSIASLRGYSYDETAYFNHNAEKYTKKVYPEKREVRTGQYDQSTQTTENDKVRNIVSAVIRSRVDMTQGYENWFRIACALAHEFGDSGRGYFHDVSQFHPQYSASATDKKFDSILKSKKTGGYSIATFYDIANQCGVGLKQIA